MKFKKLNENSVRCLISKEEMFDMGIDIDDLIDDHSKAEEFLRDVVEQAKDEVGFETTGNAFNVQLSIMPEGDISLMITEDENTKLRNMLSQFKERIKEFQENVKEAQNGQTEEGEELLEDDEIIEDGTVSQEDKAEDGEVQSQEVRQYLEIPLYAQFASLDICIRVSRILSWLGKVESALYKYQDSYYMKFCLNQLDIGITEAILTISEYSMSVFPEGQGSDIIVEHGTVMLAEDAIEFLDQIS